MKNNTTVMVDLDSGEFDADNLALRLSYTEHKLACTFTDIHVYNTTMGQHIYAEVAFADGHIITPGMLAYIQLVLGDDWKRALFNMSRIKNGVDAWNILFSRKVASSKYFYHGKLHNAGDVLSEERTAPALEYELEKRLTLRRMMGLGILCV